MISYEETKSLPIFNIRQLAIGKSIKFSYFYVIYKKSAI